MTTTLSTGESTRRAAAPARSSTATCRCAAGPELVLSVHARSCRRHVILPKHVSKNAPKGRLLSESEWRGLGVQQSRGWVHYAIHRPEPHILLFRRPQGTDPTTGLVHGKRIDPATGKVVG